MDLLKEIQETIAKFQTSYPDHTNCVLSSKSATGLPPEISTHLEKLESLAEICGCEKSNNHYMTCPWSNDGCVCGPDTCRCAMVSFLFGELKRMIAAYVKQRCPDYDHDAGKTKAKGEQQ